LEGRCLQRLEAFETPLRAPSGSPPPNLTSDGLSPEFTPLLEFSASSASNATYG